MQSTSRSESGRSGVGGDDLRAKEPVDDEGDDDSDALMTDAETSAEGLAFSFPARLSFSSNVLNYGAMSSHHDEVYFEDDESFSSAASSFKSQAIASSDEDDFSDNSDADRYYDQDYADYFQDDEVEDFDDRSGGGSLAEKGECFNILHDTSSDDDFDMMKMSCDDDSLGFLGERSEEKESFRDLAAKYNFYGFELAPETMKRSSNSSGLDPSDNSSFNSTGSAGTRRPRPSKQISLQLPDVMEEHSTSEEEQYETPQNHQSFTANNKSVRFVPSISASYYDDESYKVLTPQELAVRLAREQMSASQRHLQVEQQSAQETSDASKTKRSSKTKLLKRSSSMIGSALGAAATKIKDMVSAGDRANTAQLGKDVATQNPDSRAVQTFHTVGTQNSVLDPNAIDDSGLDETQEYNTDNKDLNQSMDLSNTKQQFLDSLERADKIDDYKQVGEITYDTALAVKDQQGVTGAFQFKDTVRSFRKSLERGEKIEDFHNTSETAYDASLFVHETTEANGGRFDLLQTMKSFKESVERGEAIEGYNESGQQVVEVATEHYDTHGTFNMNDAFKSFRNTLERGDNANAGTDIVDEAVDNGGLIIMNQGGGGGTTMGGGGGTGAGAQTQGAQAAQATQAMAVQAAGNAASGAAAATSATATAAATAAGATAAAATVSTATAVGVAAGVATAAAVASGVVTIPTTTPIQTIEDAVGCHPNFTVACSDVEISFLPGSRITPNSEWEAFFFDVYNSISPQCNEKYQRILQNVTLTSDTESDEGILYTTWNGCVSCWPYCPTDALFGDDGPIIYDNDSGQVVEDDSNIKVLDVENVEEGAERQLQVEDVFGDAFSLNFLEFIQEAQVELIALKVEQGIPEEELPTVGIIQGELPASETIVLLEETEAGEERFIQIAATRSPTSSPAPSSSPTSSPSEGPPPGSYVFEESLSLTFQSADGQALSASEISVLENTIVDSFQAAVAGSSDFSRESLSMLGVSVVSQTLNGEGSFIIVKARATFVSEDGSIVALNVASQESSFLFNAFEEALETEILNEDSVLAESLSNGPVVAYENASTSFNEELVLSFESMDGEILNEAETLALEVTILGSFLSTVAASEDFLTDSLSMVRAAVISQTLSDDASSILIVVEATFLSENGSLVALNFASEESSNIFDAYAVVLAMAIAEAGSGLAESLDGVPIIFSNSTSTSFSEDLSLTFQSVDEEALSDIELVVLEQSIIESFQNAVRGSDFTSESLAMVGATTLSQELSADGSTISVVVEATFVSENGSLVALNFRSEEVSDLFSSYESLLTNVIEDSSYGLLGTLGGVGSITSEGSSTSFTEDLIMTFESPAGEDLSEAEIAIFEVAILAAFQEAVADSQDFSSDSLAMVGAEVTSQSISNDGSSISIVTTATFVSEDGSMVALNLGSVVSTSLFQVFEGALLAELQKDPIGISSVLVGFPIITSDSPATSFTEALVMSFESADGDLLSDSQIESLGDYIIDSFSTAVSVSEDFTNESLTMIAVEVLSQTLSDDGSNIAVVAEVTFVSEDGSTVALNLSSKETSTLFNEYEDVLTAAVLSAESGLSESLSGGLSISSDGSSTSFTESLSLAFATASSTELSASQISTLEAAILDSFQSALADSEAFSNDSLAMLDVTIVSQSLSDDGTLIEILISVTFLSGDGSVVALNFSSEETSALFEAYEAAIAAAVQASDSGLSETLSEGPVITSDNSSTSFEEVLTLVIETNGGEMLSEGDILILEEAILDSFQAAVSDGSTSFSTENLSMVGVTVMSQALSSDGTSLELSLAAVFLSKDGSVAALNFGSQDSVELFSAYETELIALIQSSEFPLSDILTGGLSITSNNSSISFVEELSFDFPSSSGETLSDAEMASLESAILDAFQAAVSTSFVSYSSESLAMVDVAILSQLVSQDGSALIISTEVTFLSADGSVTALNIGSEETSLLFENYENELAMIIASPDSNLSESLAGAPYISSDSSSVSFVEELSFLFPSASGEELSAQEIESLESAILDAFQEALASSETFSTDTLTMVGVAINEQSLSSDGSSLIVLAEVTFLSKDGSTMALNLGSRESSALFDFYEIRLAMIVLSPDSDLSESLAGVPFIASETGSTSFTEDLSLAISSSGEALSDVEVVELEAVFLESFRAAILDPSTPYSSESLSIVGATIATQNSSGGGTSVTFTVEATFLSRDGSIVALNINSAGTSSLLDAFQADLTANIQDRGSGLSVALGEVLSVTSSSSSTSFTESLVFSFQSLDSQELSGTEIASLEQAILDSFQDAIEDSNTAYGNDSLAMLDVSVTSQALSADGEVLTVNAEAVFLSANGSVVALNIGSPDTLTLLDAQESALSTLISTSNTGLAVSLSSEVSVGSDSPSTSFSEDLNISFPSVDRALLPETELSVLEQAIIQSFRSAILSSGSYSEASLSLMNVEINGQTISQDGSSLALDITATFISADGTVFALNTGASETISLFDYQESHLAAIISNNTSGLSQSISAQPVINSESASISFAEELSFVFPSIDGSKLSSLERSILEQFIAQSFQAAVLSSDQFGSKSLTMARARIGSQSTSDDKSTLTVLVTATFVSSDGTVFALNIGSNAVLELLGLQEQELALLIANDNTSLSASVASQVVINSESSSISFTEAMTFTFPSADRRQLNWAERRSLEQYIVQSFQSAVSGSTAFTRDSLFMANAQISSQSIGSDRASLLVSATTTFVSSDGSIFALNMGSSETVELIDTQETDLAALVANDNSMADSISGEVLINSDSTSTSFEEEIALAFPSSGSKLTSVELNNLELAIKDTFSTTVSGSTTFESESLAIARVQLRSQTTEASRRVQLVSTVQNSTEESESGSTTELVVAGEVIFLSLDGSVPLLDFADRETTNLFLQLEFDLGSAVADPVLGLSNSLLGKPVISFPALFSPSPTLSPTDSPTFLPSSQPSQQPSISAYPSMVPSNFPTEVPSETPTLSKAPSDSPTDQPSTTPSLSSMPTASARPSPSPSVSFVPTLTAAPTETPTISSMPSIAPSESPSVLPSSSPSSCLHNTTCVEGRKPCVGSEPFCAWTNSCNGRSACRNAPGLDAEEDACRGKSACEGAAGTSVGDGSCVDEDGNGGACKNLENGVISTNSCRGTEACADTTSVSLIVASNSCLGSEACKDIAKKRRSTNTTIGENSCQGDRACVEFAGLSIGANSCNCFECCACWNWRYPGRPFLDNVIPDNSCNALGECCPVSSAPSDTPSDQPSDAPSDEPSDEPSDAPSDVPSASPSDVPSSTPSAFPSSSPTIDPCKLMKAGTDVVLPGGRLNSGGTIVYSLDGTKAMRMRSDQNFVSYRVSDGYRYWAVGSYSQITYPRSMWVQMRTSGSLVIWYDRLFGDNDIIWSTGTGPSGNFLRIMDSGYPRIYSDTCEVVWDASTTCPRSFYKTTFIPNERRGSCA